MEYLVTRESVLNCPICRTAANRRQKYFLDYPRQFSPVANQLWQFNHVPFLGNVNYLDHDKPKKHRDKRNLPSYMSPSKEGYEQIYRKLLQKKEKSNHKEKKQSTKKPGIVYQVYTLSTNTDQPGRKASDIIYSYPYSSSSSDTTIQDKAVKEGKKSVSMHPSAKTCSDEEDTDSECGPCNKLPITEKHYRQIVDGLGCSTSQKPCPLKRKQEKFTKRADVDFNQNYFEQPYSRKLQKSSSKPRKKCCCKSKCKVAVEEDHSDSELSEKTFTKFINSLHSYVNKAKKYSHYKNESKKVENDSSCSMCRQRIKHIEKKSKVDTHGKKQHHHHHHRHHHHRQKPEPEDLMEKFFPRQ